MTRVESIQGDILVALCHPDPDRNGDSQAEDDRHDPAQALGSGHGPGTDDDVRGHLILLSPRDLASLSRDMRSLRRRLIRRIDHPIDETGEIA
jgi:hypothetical protein